MGYAYLAYASGDAEIAKSIVNGLSAHSIEVASDEDRKRHGSTLSAEAEAAIALSYAVIVLITKRSEDDLQVRRELEEAIQRQKPVFPVILDDPDLEAWWHERLFNIVKIQGHAGDASVVEKLAASLSRFDDRLCPVVALMNMKGGVGKTTIASQVFSALQKARGNRVLLIDLDPQHNLSQLFFRRSTQDTLVYLDASIISLFEPSSLQGQPSPAENWHLINMQDALPPEADQVAHRLIPEDKANGGRFDLVCGQFDIAKYAFMDQRAWTARARANFRASINHLRRSYDLIVLDTNPSASFLTTAALAVATRILAPMRTDRFSIRGVRLLNDLMTRLVEEPGRPPISIVFNGIERTAKSDIETALEAGELDQQIGFPASRSVLKGRLHMSRFLAVRDEGIEDDPLSHLATYRATGIWGGPLKESLNAIAEELAELLGLQDQKLEAKKKAKT
jgi:cellulose biosynthesis protein BcsQ